MDNLNDLCWSTSDEYLNVITGADLIAQKIFNRLNTEYDELNWLYEDYGCNFREYVGEMSDSDTLIFIQNSIEDSLSKDAGLDNFEVTVELKDNIISIVVLAIVDDETVELELNV